MCHACIVGSGCGGWACDLGFEVGEAAVLEPHVRPGCFQPFVQGPVVGGELPYSLFERAVLGGDVLDGLLGPFGLQVPDLAQEFSDAGALRDDLGVGGLQGVFGVERAFPPGRFLPGVLGGQVLGSPRAVLGRGAGYGGPGLRVVVEEGAGDSCAPGDGSDGDLVRTVSFGPTMTA